MTDKAFEPRFETLGEENCDGCGVPPNGTHLKGCLSGAHTAKPNSVKQTKREDLLYDKDQNPNALHPGGTPVPVQRKERSISAIELTPGQQAFADAAREAEEATTERRALANQRMTALAAKLAEEKASFWDILQSRGLKFAEGFDPYGRKAIVIALEDIAESDMNKNKR